MVLVLVRREDLDVQGQRRVDRVPAQRVAGRVDADLLDELLERHDHPGPLGELDLLAAAHDLHQLPDQHLDGDVGVVAGAGRDGPQPLHVPVVVGAEQVDADVETARPLVDVVRGVRREVGELAVGLDQDPVLVVAEVGRAQPHGAVLLEDVALLAQLGQAALDRSGVVHGPLGGPHVEVRAEAVEHGPVLGHLQLVAGLAERLGALVDRQGRELRVLGRDQGAHLDDVVALVPVRRHRQPGGRGSERGAEPVHLHAAVVDVELPGHHGAGRRQHPGHRVAHRRPAGVPQVQRPGRVGRDELEVDPRPVQRVRPPVRRPRPQHRRGHRARGGGVEGDVEEPRPCDVHRGDARCLGQVRRDGGSDIARRAAGLLGQLQRHVGRVVTVLADLRTLDRGAGGHVDRVEHEVAGRHGGPHRGQD